jgi:hypothetical protein
MILGKAVGGKVMWLMFFVVGGKICTCVEVS